MRGLIQDLEKNEIKPVYLLLGEENYIKRQYLKKLKDACLPPDDTINYNKFDSDSFDSLQVVSLAQTLPFFAEKRVIVLERTGVFKSAGEELVKLLEEPLDNVCMIFVEDEADKRKKLFKTIKQVGRVSEFPRQDTKTLVKWVRGLLKMENRTMTDSALQLFLEKTGSSMDTIHQELEKLLCYTMNSERITSEDVKLVCCSQTTNQIFEMISAIAEKRQKQALSLYYDLLFLKEPPMRILYLLTRQFNLLLHTKKLAELGKGRDEIAAGIGLSGYVTSKYISQAKSFSAIQLKNTVEECARADADIKTGKLTDRMAVELLIVSFSSKE